MRPPSRMQIVFLFLTIVVVVAARHAREPDAEDYDTDDHVHHHHHGYRHGRQHHHHRRRHDATAEEFPPSVKISGNETLFARTEEDVHVSCSATGHPVPKITWQRLVGRMPPTNAPHSHNGSLHIRRAQVADSGVYECVGSNGVSPDASAQVEIRVQGPRSRRGGGFGKLGGRRRKNKNNGSKQQKKEKKKNKKDPKKPRFELKSAEIIQAAAARPKRTTASPAVEQLDEIYPDDIAAQPQPANAQPAAQQHEEIYPDDTVAQPQQAITAAQLRLANAQSAAEQFKGPPFTNPYTLPRLPETLSEAGTLSTAQAAAKPCLYPYDALVGLQAVVKSCTIQALIRYYRNMACWQEDISECYRRKDCENKEVRLIHEVLSNPQSTLTKYMNEWKYKQGEYQDYEEVISSSLIYLGRRNRDPTDDTTNVLGALFNVKVRSVVEGGIEGGLLTHIPFQPVVDDLENPRLDFTGPSALLEAVTRTEYFESDRFGDYLTKFLRRPKNTNTTYYDDHNIKVYMEGDGRTAAGTFVIPGTVIRTIFRFQPLDDSNLKRTLPVSFENGGRTWKLHGLVVDNEKKNHIYNMFLVWKGEEEYECWKMSGNKDPVHCSGEPEGDCIKEDCTRNRVLFAGYVVRDPSMDL